MKSYITIDLTVFGIFSEAALPIELANRMHIGERVYLSEEYIERLMGLIENLDVDDSDWQVALEDLKSKGFVEFAPFYNITDIIHHSGDIYYIIDPGFDIE